MASFQLGGIRLFAVTLDPTTTATYNISLDELEDIVNRFLDGAGTVDEPKKMLTQPPQYYIDETNSVASVLITYSPIT